MYSCVENETHLILSYLILMKTWRLVLVTVAWQGEGWSKIFFESRHKSMAPYSTGPETCSLYIQSGLGFAERKSICSLSSVTRCGSDSTFLHTLASRVVSRSRIYHRVSVTLINKIVFVVFCLRGSQISSMPAFIIW